MIRKLIPVFVVFLSGSLVNADAEADSGYHAPSSSYGAPSYSAPSYKDEVVHTHHHYHHNESPKSSYKPSYQAPAPSYHAPTYHAPAPSYHPPAPSYHPPQYNSYNYAPYHGHTYYDDEEYIHLNKKEVTRGALLFGAGLLKGIIVTGLINNANNGITIGKKR